MTDASPRAESTDRPTSVVSDCPSWGPVHNRDSPREEFSKAGAKGKKSRSAPRAGAGRLWDDRGVGFRKNAGTPTKAATGLVTTFSTATASKTAGLLKERRNVKETLPVGRSVMQREE